MVVKAVVLVLTLIFLPRPASAEKWTPADTTMQLAFGITLAMDWKQTRAIVKVCREGNPIIGLCGEHVSADLYMFSVFALNTVIVAVLPQPYRRIVQLVSIYCEVDSVVWNVRFGKGIEF